MSDFQLKVNSFFLVPDEVKKVKINFGLFDRWQCVLFRNPKEVAPANGPSVYLEFAFGCYAFNSVKVLIDFPPVDLFILPHFLLFARSCSHSPSLTRVSKFVIGAFLLFYLCECFFSADSVQKVCFICFFFPLLLLLLVFYSLPHTVTQPSGEKEKGELQCHNSCQNNLAFVIVSVQTSLIPPPSCCSQRPCLSYWFDVKDRD